MIHRPFARPRLSRRDLLRATGASALLLPLLGERSSHAADPPLPLRVIFVVTSNGTIEDKFWPTGSGASFALNEITAPLEAHKSRLLFPKGIDLKVWAEDNPFGGNGDAHHNYGALLTGTVLATGDPPHDPGGPGLALASSQSIDQYIGAIQGAQAELPFWTLNVRARGTDGSGYGTVSWSGSKAPVTSESDPVKLFDSLFAGISGSAPDPALTRLRKKRQSVLDYVGRSLERRATRLGTEDRHKIELHLNSIRTIERQLAGPRSATCEPPSVAAADYMQNEMFPSYIDTQIDLITAALACDMTRSVTLVLGDSNDYDTYFPWLDIEQTGIEFETRHHHDISHRPGENDRDKIVVETWFMTKFQRLLDRLEEMPEGDGTMLDNTVVLWMNSLNSGFGHTVLNLPWIVAAGSNVPIRTGGRTLDLGSVAHNPLLASIANAVGVPLEGWGDPRYPGTLDLG